MTARQIVLLIRCVLVVLLLGLTTVSIATLSLLGGGHVRTGLNSTAPDGTGQPRTGREGFGGNHRSGHTIVIGRRDPTNEERATAVVAAPIVGTLELGTGTPSAIVGSWPWFRGPKYDGISVESVSLLDTFPTEGPPTLWELSLGYGYAGAAIKDGRVYILDYDMENKRDALRCLSLDNGQEIWRFSYPVIVKINHGMSRTTPAVTEKYCVSLGPKCHLVCLDRLTGKEIWNKNLVTEYESVIPLWYAGQCPLVVQENGRDILILAPSGPEVLMCAIDLETGKELWRMANPFEWNMTHASVVPMTLDGTPTYIYSGSGGVAACDGHTGKILWSTTKWMIKNATCPSPLVVSDNRVFLCGGYGVNSMMLKIRPNLDFTNETTDTEPYKADVVFSVRPNVFGSTQQTPIFYDGHIFGVREKDSELVCLDLDGNVVWHSDSVRFGLGPYLIADGKILVLDDSGKLTIARAQVEKYEELGSYQILDGHDAWAPMALVHGRLILREFATMRCVDIRK